MTKLTPMAANEDDSASRRRIHLREISGDADAPLETVGQDLRAARIRRGDDLAAVSRALKIRKDHLDALESDQIDRLPGKTYAIGFVRSYARYLGLDAGVLAERFKAEISGRGEEPGPPPTSLHEDDSRRLPYGWRILAAVIGLALLWGIWHIFFADRWDGTDDALYVAMRLICVLSRTGRSLAEFRRALPPVFATPELRIPCPEARKAAVVREVAARRAGDGALFDPALGLRVLAPEGWWLLRASGTEAKLTCRCEADSPEALERLEAEMLAELGASGVGPG